MVPQRGGLRARKKERVRANISDQATRLFLERGFDTVTIAEVAAAAEVSKMTVTNYFPRKEDLALDLHDEFVQMPAEAVRRRGAGESALAALHRSFVRSATEHDPVIGFSGPAFARMVTGSPALVSRLRQFHDDRQAALAAALREETGAAAGDVMPVAAAALLGGVLRMLFDETVQLTLAGRSDAQIADTVIGHARTAFGLLEPSLGDYAVRRASDSG